LHDRPNEGDADRGITVGRKRALAALGIGASALLAAPNTAVAQHRTFNSAVVAQDFVFRGIPRLLPAGTYETRLLNLGQAPHVIVAINLGASCGGLSTAELINLFDQVEDEATFLAQCPDGSVGGDIFALPGEQARGPLALTPGRNVFVCFVGRHYALGMISSTQVINIG